LDPVIAYKNGKRLQPSKSSNGRGKNSRPGKRMVQKNAPTRLPNPKKLKTNTSKQEKEKK